MNSSFSWKPPLKPAEAAEYRLIQAILENKFPINTYLPGERELSIMLGVTRPTLREAMQRMARDGWVDIQHGKPTRIKNFWKEGNLGVLAALVRYPHHFPDNFIPNLLQVRSLMAPTYTRLAIEKNAQNVTILAEGGFHLQEQSSAYAEFDWRLHLGLTQASENPVFTLILNGFQELYPLMANLYFKSHKTRQASKEFYISLKELSRIGDAIGAEELTQRVMIESITYWTTRKNMTISQLSESERQ